MQSRDVVIIGGGQAGLAMSRCLSVYGIEHVVIERGEIGERWRTSTWDTLRLLTPNWMNRLPGAAHTGGDPDDFIGKDEFVAYLEAYAKKHETPVLPLTTVLRVDAPNDGYRVLTDRGAWRARAVVIATGQCDLARVPEAASRLDGRIASLHSSDYRNPASVPDGGVLVVGASSSGVQIAEELRCAGRQVAISVGRHTRLPRLYRDRDIFYWLDRIGLMTQRLTEMRDPAAAMRQPSLQLAGRPDRRNMDLAALQGLGIRLLGRLCAMEGGRAEFAPTLSDSIRAADEKLARLLDDIDRHAGDVGAQARHRDIAPVVLPDDGGEAAFPLADAGIRTVIWATGYRRAYPWLDLPILDPTGEISHTGGVTVLPGVYALGLRLLRRRNSNFIGGVGADARELAGEVARYLGHSIRRVA